MLGVGLAPVAQMLVLPPLIFCIVAGWRGRASDLQGDLRRVDRLHDPGSYSDFGLP